MLRRLLLVVILLVATALRAIDLDNFPTPQGTTPPGLEHDEVAHWLINRAILAGHHAVYFTEAYGHEALYHYAQAFLGSAIGDHAFALRLPSVYLGVLLCAVSYALGRRLFDARMGLLAAAFLAILFWPVFYSRLALRAIMLPVLAGLSAVAWWVAQGAGERTRPVEPPDPPLAANQSPPLSPSLPRSHAPLRTSWFLVSGLLAGLSLHTYMAARAVPIFYALFTAYLALFQRGTFRASQRGLVAFWLALVAVALPLAAFLMLNPGAEARIGEVDEPLRVLLAGDPRPVILNAIKIASGFALRGDPLWRQGIAGRPVFDPVLGLLFYGGVAICFWRWRQPRYAFMLLWLGASAVPSLVTIDAPSTIRMINMLPVLPLFPFLAARSLLNWTRTRSVRSVKADRARIIHIAPQLSTVWTRLSTDLVTTLSGGVLILLLLYHVWQTTHGLWRVWPASDEVQFVWQAALTEAGAYLDTSSDAGPVAIGGWTPDTMDPPTMELTLRRDDLALRYFNPAESLILPAPAGGAARVVRPAILPLAPALEAITGPWLIIAERAAPGRQFALYRYEATPKLIPTVPLSLDFGEELRLLGYDVNPGCADVTAPCELVTYWRVLAQSDGPRRIFLHLVGPNGQVAAQDDRLGAPAQYWRPGDVVVQLLTLPRTDGQLRLGVYDPVSGERLRVGEQEYYEISRSAFENRLTGLLSP